MALSNENHQSLLRPLGVAQLIDSFVKNILAKGGGEEQILAGMLPYMQGFKGIMNNAAAGEMNLLATQYNGFISLLSYWKISRRYSRWRY